jgi:hypothetical protein
MNHDEATRYFDELGERIPDRRPAMPELLVAGKRAERRRMRRAVAISVAAAVLVAGGVALARGVIMTDDADPVAGGDSPVLTLPEWNGWPDAEVKGVVSLHDGCLYIGDFAAVWPRGSTWDASEQAVQFESLTIGVGQYVSGGGGYYTIGTDAGSAIGDATWDLAQQCARLAGGGEVVAVRPDSVRAIEEPAMTVTPTTAHPGDAVSLSFPTEQLRGVGFILTARDGGTTYQLTSNAMDRGREPTWSPEGSGWVDVGISGPGPDQVLIPPVAAPGDYELCTGNAPAEQCVSLTVA